MARAIVRGIPERETAESIETAAAFQAVAHKRLPPTPDFTQSATIVLSDHRRKEDAWRAVFAAMRDGDYIGGEVRPCTRM
jgi:hypothetical protein